MEDWYWPVEMFYTSAFFTLLAPFLFVKLFFTTIIVYAN